VVASAWAANGAACESLKALTIANTEIAAARQAETSCRVMAIARPTADSVIRIEVWLPVASNWNGRLLGTGNGGYSGAIGIAEMEARLREGYAVAGSDTGHEGGDLKFGLGHPEKIRDWGDRAVHVMTETAKAVVRSYYGRSPEHSYFAGCSTGGQQALTEAQRYPGDYDGIVAGAPGNNRVRLNVGFLWSWLAVHKEGGELPASKLPMIAEAVVAACDALDGLKDGLISDPLGCGFDPGSLLCRDGDGPRCLTAGQAAAVRAVYDGARNPRTGERIYAGWTRGSESGWGAYFVGQREPARLDFWRHWVFDDAAWDFRSFIFDRDVRYADEKMGVVVANDPDLREYEKRHGKLLMYQGWADPVVPAADTIRYFESVERAMGGPERTAGFVRLFLAPGMGHCGGGVGPNSFDAVAALDRWVSKGAAPERIVASHATNGVVDRTRPLCAYPLMARWNGTASVDEAGSFGCAPRGR
jgi:feruloyl esterase